MAFNSVLNCEYVITNEIGGSNCLVLYVIEGLRTTQFIAYHNYLFR